MPKKKGKPTQEESKKALHDLVGAEIDEGIFDRGCVPEQPEDEPPFTEADFLDALKKVSRKLPEKEGG